MKKERTIRLHALREGDEVFYDGRWWQVGKLISVTNVDMRSFEIKRGSKVGELTGRKDGIVRIMRSAPIKEKNGGTNEG